MQNDLSETERRRNETSAPVVNAIRTDVPCQRPACREALVRLTRQAEESMKRRYHWNCPVRTDHVTPQFVPPYEYDQDHDWFRNKVGGPFVGMTHAHRGISGRPRSPGGASPGSVPWRSYFSASKTLRKSSTIWSVARPTRFTAASDLS